MNQQSYFKKRNHTQGLLRSDQSYRIKTIKKPVSSIFSKNISTNAKKNELRSSLNSQKKVKVRISTQSSLSKSHPYHNLQLPRIRQHSNRYLQNLFIQVVVLFEKIQRIRVENGVMPMKGDGKEGDLFNTSQFVDIPYNPEMFEMNEQIRVIKIKIEQKMNKIIRESKNHPYIQKKIEHYLCSEYELKINENQNEGKLGAMKAQKRLIDASTTKMKRILKQQM